MKIKEVAYLTGITKANIRYYESEGLLLPNRESNGYRTYDEAHIKSLLKIKLLRTLGLPVETIKLLGEGRTTLEAALTERKVQFQRNHEELALSERIVDMLLASQPEFDELKPEDYLAMLDGQTADSVSKDVNPKPVLPWRRMWARTLDFAIYNLILYALVPALFRGKGINLLLIPAEIMMLVAVEPVLLSLICTTPGKLVFGMTVTGLDGGRLAYKAALERTLLVLQHGLGFCAPFLREYMQISSYAAAENGGELIWEQNSELNIRDTKPWRYVLFLTLLSVVMAYPAKEEFTRIFDSNDLQIRYEGETPFDGDYMVEEVLYCADSENSVLPLVRLTANEMRFSCSGNTAGDYALAGTFRYAPPAEDPSAGVWELQAGSAADTLYRLTADGEGGVVLDCYENLEWKHSWKLKSLDVLNVEFRNSLTRLYIAPQWYEQGSFDGNVEALRPKRITSKMTVTLHFDTDMPESMVIRKEIYRGEQAETKDMELHRDEKGNYQFEHQSVNEDGDYILYRIGYAGGELLFAVLC